MKITEEMVDRCAELARLRLEPEERPGMAAELEEILAYMDVLGTLDTAEVEPLIQVLPLKNVVRADEPAPCLERAALLSGAPATDGEMFLVPRAVE